MRKQGDLFPDFNPPRKFPPWLTTPGTVLRFGANNDQMRGRVVVCHSDERQLLGVCNVTGTATWVLQLDDLRGAEVAGYTQVFQRLSPGLRSELDGLVFGQAAENVPETLRTGQPPSGRG
jgi:hypothetical protein